jgi:hypothetical protein
MSSNRAQKPLVSAYSGTGTANRRLFLRTNCPLSARAGRRQSVRLYFVDGQEPVVLARRRGFTPDSNQRFPGGSEAGA